MAVLETKHTRSRLNVIKRDLLKSITIFSAISMLIFLSYYAYLFVKNIHKPLYLVVYSVLIITIVALFLIETLIREDKKLLRNEKRLSTERKRKYKFITKIFKFVAKFAIIGVAVFESITNLEVTMSNIINIGSVVFLVVQILFEIIISTIIKQIDYLRLAVQLDIEESGIFKSLLSFVMKEKKMEDKAIIAQGGSVYTPTEGKMINIIKEDAKEYEAKGKIRKEQIKNLFKQRK